MTASQPSTGRPQAARHRVATRRRAQAGRGLVIQYDKNATTYRAGHPRRRPLRLGGQMPRKKRPGRISCPALCTSSPRTATPPKCAAPRRADGPAHRPARRPRRGRHRCRPACHARGRGPLLKPQGARRDPPHVAFRVRPAFKSHLGVHPLEYLIQWRMSLARDALTRDSLPISELARATGYQSESAFSTAFASSAHHRHSSGTRHGSRCIQPLMEGEETPRGPSKGRGVWVRWEWPSSGPSPK